MKTRFEEVEGYLNKNGYPYKIELGGKAVEFTIEGRNCLIFVKTYDDSIDVKLSTTHLASGNRVLTRSTMAGVEMYIDRYYKREEGVLYSVKVAGHRGEWSQIAAETFTIRNDKPETLFLMEHDTYGEEAACIVVDREGLLIANDCQDGFDDLRYKMENRPMEEWT